jgi:hypothetical protein
MITDALLWLGVTILDFLVGWLPVSTFDAAPWLSVASGAGNLFGIIVNVSALFWCVTAVLTIEGGLLLVRSGGWLWSWIRG